MWIDEWLLQEGKTVTDFAKEMDIHRAHLHSLIVGRRRASQKLSEKISEATKGKISARRIRNLPVPDRLKRKKP